MSQYPKVAFIGAGSTIFMKNIVGDLLQREALRGARLALMDIDPERLKESEVLARKLVSTLDAPAVVSGHSDQQEALDGADFVVVAFPVSYYTSDAADE